MKGPCRRTVFLSVMLSLTCTQVHGVEKPRLLILTDIGGDPDDRQSMIRLMTYACDFEIEGLIASAAGMPGELGEKVVKPQLIEEIVRAYGEVRKNLIMHRDGYPAADVLLSRIKSGNPDRGLQAVGEGHDTEGSKWIVSVVDRDDPRPVHVSIWGGQTDLAQALWRVREDRGEDGIKKFLAKLRVYDVGDQDGIADWIVSEFPDLFYVLAKPAEGKDRREAAYRGMYLGGDESLASREWMETNIRSEHGPLGALYPPRTWTAPNPHSAIKEGDTPSWFYHLPHGLNDPGHPEWGGWGGRYVRRENHLYRDAKDTVGNETSERATVWRWRPAFQADFQARLDWCVTNRFEDANHSPVAVLNGDASRNAIEMSVRSGDAVRLFAVGSHDPDEDAFQIRWLVYPKAGTYRGDVALMNETGLTTEFTAPRVSETQTVHVILEIRDDGAPGLYAHRRAVIVIQP